MSDDSSIPNEFIIDVEEFVPGAVNDVVEKGILNHIDLTKLSDDEIANLPHLTRGQANTLAKGFLAKHYNPVAHRTLARSLALHVALETDIPVDVDGDGVPDVPRSPERRSWFDRFIGRRDDYDDA